MKGTPKPGGCGAKSNPEQTKTKKEKEYV